MASGNEIQARIGLDTTPLERAVIRVQDSLKSLGTARGERGASAAIGGLAGVGAGVDSLSMAAGRLSDVMRFGLGPAIGVAFTASIVEGMVEANNRAMQLDATLNKISYDAAHIAEGKSPMAGMVESLKSAQVELMKGPQDFIGRLGEFWKFGGATILSLFTTGGLDESRSAISSEILNEAKARLKRTEPGVVAGILGSASGSGRVEGGLFGDEADRTRELGLQLQHREHEAKALALVARQKKEIQAIDASISQFNKLGLNDAAKASELYKKQVEFRQANERDLFNQQREEAMRDARRSVERAGMMLDGKPGRKLRGELFDIESLKSKLSEENDALTRRKLKAELGAKGSALESTLLAGDRRAVVADSLQRMGGGGNFYAGDTNTDLLRSAKDSLREIVELLRNSGANGTMTANAQLIY